MDNTLFQHLIDHQEEWRELYIQQEKQRKELKRQKINEANWFGNSKEYKVEWDLQNNRKKSQGLP
jgi:hypothetical protein